MVAWRYHIELNKVLDELNEQFDLSRYEEDCPSEVKEAIVKEISKAMPLKRFVPTLRDSLSIAEVNRVIQCIYDEADRSLVWCGL